MKEKDVTARASDNLADFLSAVVMPTTSVVMLSSAVITSIAPPKPLHSQFSQYSRLRETQALTFVQISLWLKVNLLVGLIVLSLKFNT